MIAAADPPVDRRSARALLEWYDGRRRSLPWRQRRDPWAILVSEIMLQQTRVETVIPYFERFMERFPAPLDLASTDVEEVLGLWSGLGYYQRARRLHAAACRIVEEGGGNLPSTITGLLDLPGVGPYTAAAVGSIAFGLVEPVLDGNVERVVGRLLALATDPKRVEGRAALLAKAGSLLDPARPGDSNQALMELGATVCGVRSPDCESCPLGEDCAALAGGAPESYPRPRTRRAPRLHHLVAAVVREDSRVLLFRRPHDAALLAGLWELPWAEVSIGDRASGPASSREEVEKELSSRYGGSWTLGEHLASTRHAITHRALEVEAVRGGRKAPPVVAEGPEAGWFGKSELDRLPVSSLVWKILGSLRLD